MCLSRADICSPWITMGIAVPSMVQWREVGPAGTWGRQRLSEGCTQSTVVRELALPARSHTAPAPGTTERGLSKWSAPNLQASREESLQAHIVYPQACHLVLSSTCSHCPQILLILSPQLLLESMSRSWCPPAWHLPELQPPLPPLQSWPWLLLAPVELNGKHQSFLHPAAYSVYLIASHAAYLTTVGKIGLHSAAKCCSWLSLAWSAAHYGSWPHSQPASEFPPAQSLCTGCCGGSVISPLLHTPGPCWKIRALGRLPPECWHPCALSLSPWHSSYLDHSAIHGFTGAQTAQGCQQHLSQSAQWGA